MPIAPTRACPRNRWPRQPHACSKTCGFDARQLADKLTPQQRAKDFAQCGLERTRRFTP